MESNKFQEKKTHTRQQRGRWACTRLRWICRLKRGPAGSSGMCRTRTATAAAAAAGLCRASCMRWFSLSENWLRCLTLWTVLSEHSRWILVPSVLALLTDHQEHGKLCSWYLCWQRKTSLVLQTRWKDKHWLRSVSVKVNWSKSNLSYHLRYEHRLWSFELFSRTKNASLSFQTGTKQEAEGNTASIRTPQRRLKSEQKDTEPLIPAFPPLIRGLTFRASVPE